MVFLTEPVDYRSFTSGLEISADSVDIVARQILEQNMHEAYAGTAAVCTGTAARIPGTIVNELVSNSIKQTETVRIGSPSGVFPIKTIVKNDNNEPHLIKASFGRTARIIMDGHVHVRNKLIE